MTERLRERARASARVALTALTAVGALLAAVAAPAHAWKPRTHIYFAEQALKDAVDNGKVTIYETDYQTGKVLGVLGEYPVEPRILEALKKAPKHYRAGVLGPDAYPDIVTGQKIIHPHASHNLDGHAAGGTNSWLTHLWNLSYGPGTQPANSTVPPIIGITMRNDSPAVRAFVVGYITHAAGDMYAHTFMNQFTGGEFMLKPDPRNALKHIVLEGYVGKRTPLTVDTFGTSANNPPESLAAAFPGASFSSLVAEEARRRNALGNVTEMLKVVRQYEDALVTENDISITGLEMYLWKELTWARPGSVLKRQLLEVEDRNYSVPYLFSELRNSLQKEVDAYYARSTAGRIAYTATHPGRITFIEHWIKDIDNGLQAWPKLSHQLAQEFIFNETHGGADLPAAKKAIDDYVKNYLVYMGPVPDIAVDALKFMASIMDALVPDAIKEAIKDLVIDAVNKIAKAATGRTLNEWAEYISNPETHFDPIMNGPGGEHPGRTAQRITLAQMNREHLKLQDAGYTAGNKETFKIDEFPPAFNTVQLCKMLLLGKDGMNQLLDALAAKGLQKPTLPANFENVMLGWLQSLDNDNQWMGLQTKDSVPGATMVFAQNGGATYQKVFLRQVGEEQWVTPIASTPTTPNNPPVAGNRPPPPGVPTNPTTPTLPTNPVVTPAPADQAQGILDRLKGKWKTTLGTVVTIGDAMRTLPPPMLDAKASKTFDNGATAQAEGFYLEANADGSASGLWTTVRGGGGYSEFNNVGRVYITPGADGNSFTGRVITQGGNEYTYNGTRVTEENPGTTNPGSGSGGIVPPPVSNPGGMARVGDGKFYRLDNFAVRFEELKVGLDEASLELFVTKRNITTKPQGIGAGGFELMITDSDGISIRDMGNVYRPSGDRPERFDRGISVLPGNEARIRWVFPLPKGITPLKTLSIKEYVNKPVLVDISDVVLPGQGGGSGAPSAPAAPPQPTPSEPAAGGGEGFQAVGNGRFFGIDDLDVRLDGVRRGRDGATMEMIVTMRNSTSKVQGVDTTTVRFSVTDADGLETRHNGNLYRASGDAPERITHSVRVAPGSEAKIRYLFPLSKGVEFKKLNVSGYRSPNRSYDLPALAER